MSDQPDRPDRQRLEALEARIREAKRAEEGEAPAPGADLGQANMGWQMVIDLVVGIAIGLGIGYGLDRLFGTAPIFLVLFMLLGFGAGVRVMLGTAAQMQQKAAEAAREQASGTGRAADDEEGAR